MGTLVVESGLFVERVLVVAPNAQNLESFFSVLRDECLVKNVAYKECDLPAGAKISKFSRVSVGKRFKDNVMCYYQGLDLSRYIPSESTWDLADHVVFYCAEYTQESAHLLRLKVPHKASLKPLVMLQQFKDEPRKRNLMDKSLTSWGYRNFEYFTEISPKKTSFIEKSLEWVLSF